MTLEDQATRIADFAANAVRDGHWTEEEAREYAISTMFQAFTVSAPTAGYSSASQSLDHKASFVAPQDVQIAVEILRDQGLSKAQIGQRLEGGIDFLADAIAERKVDLLSRHMAAEEMKANASPDARRAQAQAQLQEAEDLRRDGVLARQHILSQGLLPEALAADLTDAESVALAFGDGDPRDAEANDLAANLRAASTSPEQWTLEGDNT